MLFWHLLESVFSSWAKKQLQKYFSWRENTWHEGTSLPNWCQGEWLSTPQLMLLKKKSLKYYLLQERPGQQTRSTSATHNFTLLLGQQVSPSVLSFLLDFRNLRLPTTCERWGPLWTTEAICSRVLHRKGDLHVFFWHLPRFESFKSQHSTSISLQTPDQRSNVHGASFIQWKHVEGHVKLFTNALRDACVPQKQSSKTTRAENYQSHSSSSYHFWFWCCFGNRKFGGLLKSWRSQISQKRFTKKTNDPVHCTPVPSYFKAFKAASQSPPQTTKVPEKGEHWCRIEMDGHV